MRRMMPGTLCDCNAPATRFNPAREPICDRCHRLAQKSAIQIRYAKGDKVTKGAYVAKGRTTQNFHEWLEEMKPSTLIPNAMARLEEMLKPFDIPSAQS
jgi:hypothetical protein